MMFGQSRTRTDTEGEFRQPLLSSRENVGDDHNVFSVSDSDDEMGGEHDELADANRTSHTVRFQEDVQVIAPSLRSTVSSREAGCSCPFILFIFY